MGLLEGNSPVLLDFASQALFLNRFNDDIDRPPEDRLELAGEPSELATTQAWPPERAAICLRAAGINPCERVSLTRPCAPSP